MNALIQKGVTIIHPESTWIDDTVNADRISESAVIHPGCRLSGAHTSVGPNCVIGEEAPSTLDNCQLAESVHLKGGYYSNSVFLDNVSVGSSAHIRPYCILEESVTCGHAVGLKQTLLLPFVALGSLINFCDCLMAGGTDRSNHSEVGSSFIHFNFSPNRHKATASLLGDVPRGVMLDQPPIFLGGQGGLVGPTSLEYGTLSAAGTVVRKDVTKANQLVFGTTVPRIHSRDFDSDHFGSITHTVNTNVTYIANLHAMREWYRTVRSMFASSSPHHQHCYQAAERYLGLMIKERIDRLTALASRVTESAQCESTPLAAQHKEFLPKWNDRKSLIDEAVSIGGSTQLRGTFVDALNSQKTDDVSYVECIKSFDSQMKGAGTAWLNSVVEATIQEWLA